MRQHLLAVTLLVLAASAAVQADDFRVESTVFANKEKKPVSQSSTVFHAGVVYDYLTDPPRTAVLDKPRGRFILLDLNRQEKAELKLEEISTAVAGLQGMAQKSTNSFLKFVSNPKFEPKQTADWLEFASSSLTYRVKAIQAPSPEVAQQYRDFLDWTARLNAVMTPAAPPPFARIAVNSEVASRNLVPETVELVIPKQIALGGRGLNMRSEHVLTRRLLEKDHDQIAKTSSQMAQFKTVPFADYRSHQPR